ncbi:tyrosinase family protein [Neptunomonas sp.]|uniref:tyrosinase family protein n=1 Tax=Neptunomonas sp. TaxID=1971898 RepID=UPI003568156B
MASPSKEKPIKDPTYMKDIRHFFSVNDINHMRCKGIELGTYEGVKSNAADIYGQTSSGHMPPDDPWSEARVQTFLNWIVAKYPLGTAAEVSKKVFAKMAKQAEAEAVRVRKDINNLTQAEVAKVRTAFEGMMARDPTDPESYFALAGTHWYPSITNNPNFHCLHHENRYNPWHRSYLKAFEDAMRSVPGCEDVTLPYWDITTPVPDLLYEAPFESYTAQASIAPPYDTNYKTQRYDAATVNSNIKNNLPVEPSINTALKQSIWEQFDQNIWRAHDNGHVDTGPTMANQDVAAFDPIFWFFHANWDRLWLEWQLKIGATSLEAFISTCSKPTAWLTIPPLNALPPFPETANQTISFPEIAYAAPKKKAQTMEFENKTGNIGAEATFRVDKTAPVSVRVKNIDRSNIPGSFIVHLMADGESIARQAFFQPNKPAECKNCSENNLVNIDFQLDQKKLHGRKLGMEIHVPSQIEEGTKFPVSSAGSPTINVRILLEGQ